MDDLDLMVCAHMSVLDQIADELIYRAEIGNMNAQINFPFVPSESDMNYLRKRLYEKGIDII